jgi:flagellar hook assembly protein FlgD
MGLLKKLVVGFFLLLFVGVAAIFGMQYYYDTAYDKVPVEVKSETVSGDVFYLSHVLEPGKYKITADSEGTVVKITILDESGNVLTESETSEFIYGSSQPFQVRIDYKAPENVETYEVSVGIYRLVKK